VGRIAEELGLSRHSVLAWSEASQALVRLRPVEVVSDPAPPRAGSTVLATPSPVLISPKGYRVEGLDVDTLAALLAVVG
jgi:hypothetical protein